MIQMLMYKPCVFGKKKESDAYVTTRETENALFAWLISHTFSVNEQYFSLTTNQPTVLSAMTYQPNEQGVSKDRSQMTNSRLTLCLLNTKNKQFG